MKAWILIFAALATTAPGVSGEGSVKRPERIARRLDNAPIVLLADVSRNEYGLTVVPREVWKGDDIRVGESIYISKRDPRQTRIGPILSIVSFRFQPTYGWFISPTDGAILGGMPDVTIDGLRRHLAKTSKESPGD